MVERPNGPGSGWQSGTCGACGQGADVGSAVRSTARSRTSLPVAVRGSCSTMCSTRGRLYGASRSASSPSSAAAGGRVGHHGEGLDAAVVDDDRALDAGQGRQRVLHLGQVHLEAADRHLRVQPAEHRHQAGRRVDPARVLGVQPAVDPAGRVGQPDVRATPASRSAARRPARRTVMPGRGHERGAVLAEQVGGDDPDLGHPVHVAQPDAVPVGEALRAPRRAPARRRWSCRLSCGSFGGFGPEASSSMWNGTPSSVVGASPAGHRAQDRVDGQPLRQHQLDARVQAVEQAADQAQHVHHGGQQHHPLAGQRHPVDPGVAVDLGDQAARAVRAMTLDGPVEPELSCTTACPVSAGRPSRACGDVGDLVEGAQPARQRAGAAHHDLRLAAGPGRGRSRTRSAGGPAARPARRSATRPAGWPRTPATAAAAARPSRPGSARAAAARPPGRRRRGAAPPGRRVIRSGGRRRGRLRRAGARPPSRGSPPRARRSPIPCCS